jgi:hypothetical protein
VISPESIRGGAWWGGRHGIAQTYAGLGNRKKAKEFFAKITTKPKQKIKKNSTQKQEKQDSVKKKKEIANWIKSDYAEMVKICRDRGLPVIIQTFPNNSYDEMGIGINHALREIAKEENVPLVDQEELFIEYIEKENLQRSDFFEFPYPNNCFITKESALGKTVMIPCKFEGHCNSQGYRLMAENIYRKIIEKGLLENK